MTPIDPASANPIAGVLLGLGAASSYSVGLVAQKRAAARLPAVGVGSIGAFLRSRSWLAGNALVALGWLFQYLGLSLAPLTVVMPAVATGLLIQAVLARVVLGERWGATEAAGVLACVLGLVLLSLSIDPSVEHASRVWNGRALALVLAGFVAAAALAARFRGTGLAVAAGFLYAGTGLLTKVLGTVAAPPRDAALFAGVVALLLALGAVALAFAQGSYQHGRAVVVLPLMCGLADFLPVATSPLVLDERWPAGLHGALRLAAVAAILGGMVLLGGASAAWHRGELGTSAAGSGS